MEEQKPGSPLNDLRFFLKLPDADARVGWWLLCIVFWIMTRIFTRSASYYFEGILSNFSIQVLGLLISWNFLLMILSSLEFPGIAVVVVSIGTVMAVLGITSMSSGLIGIFFNLALTLLGIMLALPLFGYYHKQLKEEWVSKFGKWK